jgi:hypothetical protein
MVFIVLPVFDGSSCRCSALFISKQCWQTVACLRQVLLHCNDILCSSVVGRCGQLWKFYLANASSQSEAEMEL